MRQEEKKKVLIVDNNDVVLGSIQATLENAGFDTLATWSGVEALELLRSGEFDVLVVDDYLPDLHAHDFLERVTQLPIQPWVVVMQATKPSPSEVRRYEALGATTVIDKQDFGKIREAAAFCCLDEPLARVGSRPGERQGPTRGNGTASA